MAIPHLSWLSWLAIALGLGVAAWLAVRLLAPPRKPRNSGLGSLERNSGLSRPAALWGDDVPDTGAEAAFATSVRENAEEAALRVVAGDPDAARNPFEQGRPEYVLWMTSFHLALDDLREQRVARQRQDADSAVR